MLSVVLFPTWQSQSGTLFNATHQVLRGHKSAYSVVEHCTTILCELLQQAFSSSALRDKVGVDNTVCGYCASPTVTMAMPPQLVNEDYFVVVF